MQANQTHHGIVRQEQRGGVLRYFNRHAIRMVERSIGNPLEIDSEELERKTGGKIPKGRYMQVLSRRLYGGLCVILLTGCSTAMMDASKNRCSNFGFEAGTNTYAECVQREYGAAQERVKKSFEDIGKAGRELERAATPPAAPGVPAPTTHTYFYNGRYLTCTTFAGMTNCN